MITDKAFMFEALQDALDSRKNNPSAGGQGHLLVDELLSHDLPESRRIGDAMTIFVSGIHTGALSK